MSSVMDEYMNIVTYLKRIHSLLPSTQGKEDLIQSFIQYNKLCRICEAGFLPTSSAFILSYFLVNICSLLFISC